MTTKKQNRKLIAFTISCALTILGLGALLLNIMELISNLPVDPALVTGIFTAVNIYVLPIIGSKKIMLKEIKKEYPDVDFDVNIEVLKKN